VIQQEIRQVQVGDRVLMRKVHPCGGSEWEVTRIGADIGLRCLTCGRHVMLPRSRFERQAKSILGHRLDEAAAQASGSSDSCDPRSRSH
jgi:hypothetical protein